ncbi:MULTISPECIES: bacteriohopanetetrol glucosamine biosynthesis glycosyltransferase HpnI [Paraburkholderia]|uniref:bacteriohopanetetrol glucosamine biosynthesis glycosyltransferase HpnI n=1 Tax=Paraburkholderia TaxID=1822464 RepID=UPI0009F35E44|nr:bacteriohopanetetrol glucosamine biosynthesis glycosyltransferase HpnI [Paraburkholderia terricola]ORC45701.1 glycosyl transferase [Burkholderia sp. A27]
MAAHTLTVCQWVLLTGCVGASLYAMAAVLAMPFFTLRRGAPSRFAHLARRVRAADTTRLTHGASFDAADACTVYSFVQVGVSVLKPLCGAEPRLYENLRTFCEQRHGHFQLVLGVSSPDDPAVAVARRLQAAYPALDIELAIDPRVHGSNLKVSNLINMAEHARHGVFVIADSDIAVEADYLDSVAAPLADPRVGAVTCLYVAQGLGGFWQRVGALFVNEWFAPSVRVAHMAGSRRFGFGATLALRRATLERIGGFEALKDCLADDYWLAEHVRALGLQTVLSRVMVATDVIEPTFAALWQRETRWLRTIRSVNPLGFAFLFITFPTPWLIAGIWLTNVLTTGANSGPLHWPALVSAAGTAAGLAARVLLHARAARHERAFRHPSPTSFWSDLPLVPLRDTLLLFQWIAGAFGSHVMWRGARVPVESSTSTAHAKPLRVMEASDGR